MTSRVAQAPQASKAAQAPLMKPLNAIVAINRPGERSPHLTPVWFLWDGKALLFSITKDRAKYTHIQRDPNISVMVDDQASHQYVTVQGRAEIIDGNPAEIKKQMTTIVEKYVPAQQRSQYDSLINDPGRVLIVVRPDKMVTGPNV